MNNSLTAIIVDDEMDGRLILTSLLTEYCPSVRLLGSFGSAESGIQAIKTLKPELVFLDIEMPGMNAFTMLEQLSDVTFEVIFVTAYDTYALKAIKHDAMEYILKPVDKEELIASVEKCRKRLQQSSQVQASPEKDASKLILPVREGFLFMDVAKIIRCEGDGNYTHIYLENKQKHLSSKTLKDFEQLLPVYFVRIHKSHLINTNFIKKYIKGDGGVVVMADDTELEVSRRNKDYFLKYFNL